MSWALALLANINQAKKHFVEFLKVSNYLALRSLINAHVVIFGL